MSDQEHRDEPPPLGDKVLRWCDYEAWRAADKNGDQYIYIEPERDASGNGGGWRPTYPASALERRLATALAERDRELAEAVGLVSRIVRAFAIGCSAGSCGACARCKLERDATVYLAAYDARTASAQGGAKGGE